MVQPSEGAFAQRYWHAGIFNYAIRKEVSMAVNWSKDVDQALIAAKEQNRPILLDFSAAPA